MRGPVVLFGEALASLHGATDRPLDRNQSLDLTFAGAEVNVAIGLARLGHSARWVGALGDDALGSMVLRGLRGEGVDVSQVQVRPDGPTALMLRNPRPGAEPEVFYYRRGSAMSLSGADSFPAESWAGASVLYLTGITPALSASCREMIFRLVDEAVEHGIPLWLDPNHRRKLWTDDLARRTLGRLLPKAFVVLAGLAEGEMLTGSSNPVEIGRVLRANGAARVVVKGGEAGTWFFQATEELHVPCFPVPRVVDAVGAGDGFAAGALSAHLEGLDWRAALERGNALGAMVCQTRGDWEGLPDRQGLEAFLTQRREAVR